MTDGRGARFLDETVQVQGAVPDSWPDGTAECVEALRDLCVPVDASPTVAFHEMALARVDDSRMFDAECSMDQIRAAVRFRALTEGGEA